MKKQFFILILAYLTLINYVFAYENWENSFVEYNRVKYLNAPGGFIVFNAPNKSSGIKTQTYTAAKLAVKGHVINDGNLFLLTKWSWKQYLKDKEPNWVFIKKLSPYKAKRLIKNRAKQAILALKNKDSIKLAKLAHPTLGIRFSPYAYTGGDNVRLAAYKIKYIFQSRTERLWGHYDGIGLPIRLTFTEYYQRFIYDKDFSQANQISYNEIIGSGTTLNNVFQFYPGAIIVEFHFPGFDPRSEGMDWESLRLVFQEKDNIWYIVGIIHDQWTI